MRTPLKLGAYALGLAAVFTAAVGIGHLAGPAAAPAAHTSTDHDPTHQPTAAHDQHPTGTAAPLPAGLQVTQDGYRLEPLSSASPTGSPVCSCRSSSPSPPAPATLPGGRLMNRPPGEPCQRWLYRRTN
jgi:hypothetical protein